MHALPQRTATPRANLLATTIVMLAVLALSAAAGRPASAEPAQHTTTNGVMWHAQTGTGPVADASAELVATGSGVSARLRTVDLRPGHAYTLWFVVIDNPSACANHPAPCTPADLFRNPDTQAQVTYGTGHVAGSSGSGGFAVHMPVGPIDGWLDDRVFDNPYGAEIHVVLNDHGPALGDYMPGMIRTYRGGCGDHSPFPAIFPATALADGQPGPNTCRLYQAAVFQQ